MTRRRGGRVSSGVAPSFVLIVAALASGCDLDHVFLRPGGAPSTPLQTAAEVEEPVASPRSGYLHIPDVARRKETAEPMEARLSRMRRAHQARNDAVGGNGLAFDLTSLSAALDEHIRRASFPARIGMHVRELGSGRVIFDHGGDDILIPASTNKLVTAAAALDLLGPDFRHKTLIWRDGDALVIEGRGDPTMRREDLEEIVDAVAKVVEPSSIDRIVLDDTAFTQQLYEGAMYLEGRGEAYRAPSSALSLQFNTVEISVEGTRSGQLARVELLPATPSVRLKSNVRTGASTNLNAVSRDAGDGITQVEIWGTIMPGRAQSLWRAVMAPSQFLGQAFAARFEQRRFVSPVLVAPLTVERGQPSELAELVFENESEPLAEQVRTMLTYSNNFYAEQLLRTLAYEVLDRPGDWEGGREVIAGYWDAIGNDPSQLQVVNGSGLTRTGGITARALVDLLEVGAGDASSVLASLLPENDEDGTLRGRLPRYAGRVRAKTGTLDGVSGLAGVIEYDDGSPALVFAILINVREGVRVAAKSRRALEDDLVATVIDALDAAASRPPVPS